MTTGFAGRVGQVGPDASHIEDLSDHARRSASPIPLCCLIGQPSALQQRRDAVRVEKPDIGQGQVECVDGRAIVELARPSERVPIS